MKQGKLKYKILTLLLLQILSVFASAQNLPKESIITHLSERYLLAGETLWFSVMVSNQKDLPDKQISNLAFVELVDASNRSIARRKVVLKNGAGEGMILLPDSLSSGVYHLVAYTNWLKNFGTHSFSVSRLLVLRPGDEFSEKDHSTKAKNAILQRNVDEGLVLTELNASDFARREKVILTLDLPQEAENATVSLTVRRKEPDIEEYPTNTVVSSSQPETIEYLPDYNGILLSGYARNKMNNEPMRNQEIYLSFPGGEVEVKRTVSGDDGKFSYRIKPDTGEKDMVFLTESENAGIWLEERFAGSLEIAAEDSFLLNESQVNYFTDKYINLQLKQRFDQQTREFAYSSSENEKYIFYSEPHQIVKLEDYIQLDSLHEYFYELIPTVHINHRRSGYNMYLTNPETNLRLGTNPALFIDGVYYPYPDALMKIDAEKVERVEVIPKEYYYRNMTFDGIVSVFTKNRRFMDIPLQPNAFRVFYKLADDAPEFQAKTYKESLEDNSLPDLRCLLHWSPIIKLEKGNNEQIEFFTSDVKGEFEICIKGLTDTGETIQVNKFFTVE